MTFFHHHGKIFQKVPQLTCWKFLFETLTIWTWGLSSWLNIAFQQKAHLVLYTYQNGSDDYGPVLCRCTVIADLLIRERHKPFVLIPVASLERADIWPGCLFFTQKVLPEIQVLLWNESFFQLLELSKDWGPLSLCLATPTRTTTLTHTQVCC